MINRLREIIYRYFHPEDPLKIHFVCLIEKDVTKYFKCRNERVAKLLLSKIKSSMCNAYLLETPPANIVAQSEDADVVDCNLHHIKESVIIVCNYKKF